MDVSDGDTTQPPQEAVDRDLGLGGMGLYLIAAFAGAHGWVLGGHRKHVWASVPHEHQLPTEPVLPRHRVARINETGEP